MVSRYEASSAGETDPQHPWNPYDPFPPSTEWPFQPFGRQINQGIQMVIASRIAVGLLMTLSLSASLQAQEPEWSWR